MNQFPYENDNINLKHMDLQFLVENFRLVFKIVCASYRLGTRTNQVLLAGVNRDDQNFKAQDERHKTVNVTSRHYQI